MARSRILFASALTALALMLSSGAAHAAKFVYRVPLSVSEHASNPVGTPGDSGTDNPAATAAIEFNAAQSGSSTQVVFQQSAATIEALAEVVTVINKGERTLVFPQGASISGTGFYKKADGCTGQSLSTGGTCEVTIGFKAPSEGTFSGSLSMATASQTFQAIALTATATPAPADLQVSINGRVVTAYDFGPVKVGTSAVRSVVVRNTSADGKYIPFAPAEYPFSTQNSNCEGMTLNLGDTCTMELVYAPYAVGPTDTRSFYIFSGWAPGATIKLTGTGTE